MFVVSVILSHFADSTQPQNGLVEKTLSPTWSSKGHEIVTAIGDIHQPLHAGFAEDRGGNSVDVRFNGRRENLHSLWDTALVEVEEGTPAEIAGRIQALVTSEDR